MCPTPSSSSTVRVCRSIWGGLGAGLGLVAVVLAGCGGSAGPAEPRVIAVPAEAATIAEAVAQARPGDIVEVASGIYHEAITVDVASITIRGEDRNQVVLDGRFELANGIAVRADDVAIENLTVRNFNQNGIVFNGVAAAAGGSVDPSVDYGLGDDVLRGYRVSWVTTHNNGLYGVYAFASRNGLIEHSYASGHPDSGFYVGQCRPCDVMIREVTAEHNAIGYYGTNASGGVVIASSTFRRNRLGVAPNSQDIERLAPQSDAIIVGNLIVDNDDPTAPRIPSGYFGGGIAIGGGTRNFVLRNRIEGHDRAGIELLALDGYRPEGNRIEGNVLSANAIDLAYAVEGALDAADNCFVANVFAISVPDDIDAVMPCDAPARAFALPAPLQLAAAPGVDFRTLPAPGPQPTMPMSARRERAGAGEVPVIDIAAIAVPG
jgi:hypothetical protein